MNYDILTIKYFWDIIFNISYEKTFLVIPKRELSQLKPGKTLKKSKILMIFTDINKIFAFLHCFYCWLKLQLLSNIPTEFELFHFCF